MKGESITVFDLNTRHQRQNLNGLWFSSEEDEPEASTMEAAFHPSLTLPARAQRVWSTSP
jgi:hypothetical protein